jgi:Putative MetA-pathway of phenol degradation
MGAAAGVVLIAGAADAQDTGSYTLFDPVPTDKMRDFNTDRPTKSNLPYTVDAGHFQYEGDLFLHGFDGSSTPGTNISAWTVGNPTFKVGVLDNLDLELNVPAYNSVQTTTRSTGTTTTASGVGDVVTRAKLNLFGNAGGGPALALMPYIKWPTAPQGIGNRFVEGGMAAPLAIPLPAGFTAVLMGQIDIAKNPGDNGYHVNLPALININRQIFDGVTAYAEIYADWSTRSDVRDIYTLDFALAWGPRPNLQFDIGVYIGLVPAATPYQIYAGVSQRF